MSRWLPRGVRAEVVDELDAAIDDYFADEPAEADANAFYNRLRRDFGHPALAATRFVDGRPVVSSGLALAYWRVLAVVCPAVLLARLAVAVAGLGDTGSSIDQAIHAVLKALGHLFMAIGLVPEPACPL